MLAAGKVMLEAGAIDGTDMTVAAAVTKLAYCMGRGARGDVCVVLSSNNVIDIVLSLATVI